GRYLARPPDDLEYGLRLLDARQKHRVDLAQLEFRADGLGGRDADKVHGPIQPGGPFEARSQVDRIADHRVVAAIFRTDAAGDARPAGDAYTDPGGRDALLEDLAAGDRHRGQLAKAEQGGLGAAQGHLLLRHEGRTPIRHDGVADVFVDDPVGGRDLTGHQREKGIQELDEPLGLDTFA